MVSRDLGFRQLCKLEHFGPADSGHEYRPHRARFSSKRLSHFLVAGSWHVSGLSRAALDEADACPERDDAHSGTGHDLLRAVKAESGGHGHDEVEQEQEPEHWRGGEQRLHGVSFRIWHWNSHFLVAGSWRVSGLSRAAQDEAGACPGARRSERTSSVRRFLLTGKDVVALRSAQAARAGCTSGSAADCWLRRPGMSSTESPAMTAPIALTRKAILKPAFAVSPLARTCVAMMVPAICAPTAEPMLRMTVLTPVASPVWCSSTAPTMRLGIAANAAPTPALVMQLQRMTSPTESWATAMPRRGPASVADNPKPVLPPAGSWASSGTSMNVLIMAEPIRTVETFVVSTGRRTKVRMLTSG